METEVTGGATGEPEAAAPPPAPEAAGSPETSMADEIIRDLNAAPPKQAEKPAQVRIPLSEDVLKQLESMAPEELPQSFREKLEKPFLSQYGKKTTAWDNERQSYLTLIDNLAKRLERPDAVPQDTRSKISEHLSNGEYDQATALMREEIRQEITPERQYVTTMVAINEAKQLMPDLPTYESTVAQTLAADPVLMEMANVNNRRYAGRILAGLAFQAENATLKQRLQSVEATIDQRVRAAIEETQRRIKGLPPSTSRAGSTPSATPANNPLDLRQAMEAAWQEQGGN